MIMFSCHRRSPFGLLYIRPGPRAQPQHHSSPHVRTFAKRRQFPLIGELTTGRVTDGNTNGCSNIMSLPWRITCIQPVGSLPAVARHTYLLANLQGMVVSGRQGDKCHWRSEANGVLTLNQRANDIYGRPKNILVRRRVRGLSWGITGPQYRRSPPHQKVSPPPPPRPAWAVPQSKKNRSPTRSGRQLDHLRRQRRICGFFAPVTAPHQCGQPAVSPLLLSASPKPTSAVHHPLLPIDSRARTRCGGIQHRPQLTPQLHSQHSPDHSTPTTVHSTTIRPARVHACTK